MLTRNVPLQRKTPKPRSTKPMRRESQKARSLRVEFSPERRAFRDEIGCCMGCGISLGLIRTRGSEARLEVHEICYGSKYRSKAFQDRSLWLLYCGGYPNSCHGQYQNLELPEQLAMKLAKDPWWFSLDAVRRVRNNGRDPVVVTMSDVRTAAKEIGLMG